MSSTALLCLLMLCSCCCLGAFGPLLPEIGRASQLADWQLGVVAGAFGFARMVGAMPTGWLVGHRLGTTLAASPVLLAAGLVLLAGAGFLPASGAFPVLVLGRLLVGLSQTFCTVGGLTALLLDDHGRGGSLRLNTMEFSAMIGVLGGLGLVALLPEALGWNVSLLIASSPVLPLLVMGPALRRRFPDVSRGAPVSAAAGEPDAFWSPGIPRVLWTMFTVGVVLALSWSAGSQFLIPLRGAREFGLDRAGVSAMLMLAQLVDLVALLPVGQLADRLGRRRVLGTTVTMLGLGTLGVSLGSFPWFVLGCACFGLGMAGWMLPVGMIREHTSPRALAWRTGLYRVGVDSAMFLGPLVSGLVGEAGAGVFVALVGAVGLVTGARLIFQPQAPAGAFTR